MVAASPEGSWVTAAHGLVERQSEAGRRHGHRAASFSVERQTVTASPGGPRTPQPGAQAAVHFDRRPSAPRRAGGTHAMPPVPAVSPRACRPAPAGVCLSLGRVARRPNNGRSRQRRARPGWPGSASRGNQGPGSRRSREAGNRAETRRVSETAAPSHPRGARTSPVRAANGSDVRRILQTTREPPLAPIHASSSSLEHAEALAHLRY
jgi:hypothetical protein